MSEGRPSWLLPAAGVGTAYDLPPHFRSHPPPSLPALVLCCCPGPVPSCQAPLLSPLGLCLTFALLSRRCIEREAQRHDGSHLQDDEGDILQGLPHQLQEGLGLLGRDEVLAIDLPALLQVIGVVGQAYTGERGRA